MKSAMKITTASLLGASFLLLTACGGGGDPGSGGGSEGCSESQMIGEWTYSDEEGSIGIQLKADGKATVDGSGGYTWKINGYQFHFKDDYDQLSGTVNKACSKISGTYEGDSYTMTKK